MQQKRLSTKKIVNKLKKQIRPSSKEPDITKKIKVDDLKPKCPKKIINIVLDQAVLELRKPQQTLLNFEDHEQYITNRLKRDPLEFRPDIIHQSLLTLQDSPLNKAGYLRVWIRLEDGQVISINPETKVPRTFPRFSGMIAKLLEKGDIKADDKTLLKVGNHQFKNEIVTSSHGSLVNLQELIQQNKDEQITFLVGAFSKGRLEGNESISISRYQLSTSNCLSKILYDAEQVFGIL